MKGYIVMNGAAEYLQAPCTMSSVHTNPSEAYFFDSIPDEVANDDNLLVVPVTQKTVYVLREEK